MKAFTIAAFTVPANLANPGASPHLDNIDPQFFPGEAAALKSIHPAVLIATDGVSRESHPAGIPPFS